MIAAQAAGVPVAWLVARSAGLVAFALFALAVAMGLAFSTRLLGTRRGKMVLGWHQTVMWTAVAMLVVHMVAVGLDPFLKFGVLAITVPGTAPWRTLPIAGGIVTFWIMLALAISFQVRRRIGQRRWRLLHYASFAGFTIGLYHALGVGSDLTGARGLVFAGIAASPVVWLVFARILLPRPGARPAPASRPAPVPVATAQAPRRTDDREVVHA